MATFPQVIVETRRIDTGETQVVVLGEIDLGTAPDVEQVLKKQRGRVVFDLRKVDFMDSTGVRLILTHQARLEAGGGHLRVLATSQGPVYRLIELSGMVEILDISDSLHPPENPGVAG